MIKISTRKVTINYYFLKGNEKIGEMQWDNVLVFENEEMNLTLENKIRDRLLELGNLDYNENYTSVLFSSINDTGEKIKVSWLNDGTEPTANQAYQKAKERGFVCQVKGKDYS